VQRPRYIQHLHELGAFYSSHREDFPNMFFMETPKQHFAASNDGDFQSQWLFDEKKKKGPHKCGPIANVEYLPDGSLKARRGDKIAEMVANGTWRNYDAKRILLDQYGMKLVPIYNTTVAFWDMHRSNFAGTECRCAFFGCCFRCFLGGWERMEGCFRGEGSGLLLSLPVTPRPTPSNPTLNTRPPQTPQTPQQPLLPPEHPPALALGPPQHPARRQPHRPPRPRHAAAGPQRLRRCV
jgi:hypothetical protein